MVNITVLETSGTNSFLLYFSKCNHQLKIKSSNYMIRSYMYILLETEFNQPTFPMYSEI